MLPAGISLATRKETNLDSKRPGKTFVFNGECLLFYRGKNSLEDILCRNGFIQILFY